MQPRLWMTCGVLFLAAAGAAAQITISTIGRPAQEFPYLTDRNQNTPDTDRVPFPRDFRGRWLVVYFWRATTLESVTRLREMSDLQKTFRDRGVRVRVMTSSAKDPATAATESADLGDLDALNDYWVGPGVQILQMAYGAMSEPYVVLIDPFGYLVWRGYPGEDFSSRLEQFVERTPAPGADTDYLDKVVREIQNQRDAGELGNAYSLAKHLQSITDVGSTQHSSAETLMASIEEEAQKWLESAIDLERAGKLDEACRIAGEIGVRFERPKRYIAGTGGGANNNAVDTTIKGKADNEIGRMNGDRRMKDLIRKSAKNTRGQILLEDAEYLLGFAQYDDALAIYREVIDKYDETDAATQAKELLKRYEDDATASAALAKARKQREAANLMDLADRCALSGLRDLAIEHLTRLVAEYGDTSYAPEARSRLDQWKSEQE